MIQNILVPLDGSTESEQALPLAAAVARSAGANLKLVHVVPKDGKAAHPLPPSHQGYLDLMTSKVHQVAGLSTTASVVQGPIAESLNECIQKTPADLVVMTTHGRGALSRLWLGSVTDRLIRQSHVPILLRRPIDGAKPETQWPAKRIGKILIPLDGSPEAEQVIEAAIDFGKLSGAAFHLLRIVEPLPIMTGDGMTYMPSSFDATFQEELRTQAEKYLKEIAARFEAQGQRVTSETLVHESPAYAILEASRGYDLVALATHGRGGAARFFLGSVADKVIRAAETPTLVIRASAQS